MLLARRGERLAALADALRQRYPDLVVHTVAVDVRNFDALQQLPETLPESLREIDILVNNAGLALGVAPVHQNDLTVGGRHDCSRCCL